MGRVLGLGSSGERFVDALADGHGLSPFSHHGGTERYDENLEHGTHPFDIPALHLRNVLNTEWHCLICSRLCPITDRSLFFQFLIHYDRIFSLSLADAAGCPAKRKPPRFRGL